MPLLRRVYKQGSSMVVSIPAFLLECAGIQLGDMVLLKQAEDKSIVISKADLDAGEDE